MKNQKKPRGRPAQAKVVEVVDKATVQLCLRRVERHREQLRAASSVYVPGLATYALFGIKFEEVKVELIGDSPTAADFGAISSVKSKREALARFDNLVEIRDGATRSGSVRVWSLE